MRITLVHPQWNSSMQRVAAGYLIDAATQVRPATGAGVLNETTGDVVNAAATIGTGLACRVQRTAAHGRSRADSSGDEVVRDWDYHLELDAAYINVAVGDCFTLTTAQDALLLTRTLRVVAFAGNTLHWTRVLGCTDATTG